MKRTNQGGSILSFVIIGGALVLLLVGGTYVVRHMLKPSAHSSTSVTQKDDTSSDTKKDESGSDGSSNENNAPQTDTPASSQTDTSTDTTSETQTLPTTGPSGALMSGLMLSSLVAVTAVYVRSRRELASL